MWRLLVMTALLATARSKQLPSSTELATTTVGTATEADTTAWPSSVAYLDTLTVSCEKDSMHVTVSLSSTHGRNSIYDTFNGIVYPAGLGSNSSCLREYVSEKGDLHYTLPLRGCNTMSNDNEDGTVEYYNNIIVQPHLRLVTGQGRGYHVRCRYRRRDLTHFHLYRPRADRLTNSLADDFSSDHTSDEFDEDSGLLPSVSMKIYKGDPEDKQVASNVRIGDILSLVVSLEKQRQFGLLVSECSVRDGLGWAEQSLIADDGCPLDGEIMGQFQYSSDRQTARVSFPAHKFPYTASVYYTCEVKLCDLKHPTDCEPCSHKRRVRRDDEGSPATVELFKGLYVNEADSPDNDEVTSEKKEDEICISQKNFAMGICIAGVILMICVIAAIAYILARRRNPKTYSRTGSSLYSGPYTNTGYSHTS